MAFVTLNQIPLGDLLAMANGSMEDTVSDLDFLETLAAHKCFLAPPWVMRANATGGLARVTRLTYDLDGNINKAGVLLATARQFRRARRIGQTFGGRFSQ